MLYSGADMPTYGRFGIAGVMAAWCAFALVFVFRLWKTRGPSQTREAVAWAGTALQGVALGCIWGFRRTPLGAPLVPGYPTLDLVLILACVALAWLSAGMIFWAIHTLGRQWAVAARLVEGHELVTGGPYQFVRNPIYTGLFAITLATAGVLSQPWTIAVGAPLFLAGTMVRVRAEERLLRARFGPRYNEFARRVPALLPRLRRTWKRDSL
jgi:protein-S-isoprenylcysteine O-methyltransferase Ste14